MKQGKGIINIEKLRSSITGYDMRIFSSVNTAEATALIHEGYFLFLFLALIILFPCLDSGLRLQIAAVLLLGLAEALVILFLGCNL